jgi:hypothetical protein
MNNKPAKIAAAMLILILSGGHLLAKTTIASLEEVMVKSRTILIGTYLGEYVGDKSYHIDVDTTVKGSPRTGIISVNKAKGIPRVLPGTQVMVFINAQNQWEWIGRSENFRGAPIFLAGISDAEKSEVYPSALSLVQLKDFIRYGQYSGAVEGNLRFWNIQSRSFEYSDTYFAVVYTYFNRDSVVTRSLSGGLNTGLFPNKPEVYFDGARVVLTYSDDEFRPLEIGGRVDSLKPNGHDYVADFQVWMPQGLNKQQFTQYVAKNELGPLCFDLGIQNGNQNFTVAFGEEPGEIGHIELNGETYECFQASVPTDDQSGSMKFGTWSNTAVEIVLNPVPETIDYDSIRAMPGDRMINILRLIPITGEMFVMENGQRVSRGTCVVQIAQSRFTRNLSLTD